MYDNRGTKFPKKILQAAKSKDQLTVVDDQIGTQLWLILLQTHCISSSPKKTPVKNLDLTVSIIWCQMARRHGLNLLFVYYPRAEALGFDLNAKPEQAIPIKSSQLRQLANRPKCVVLDNQKIQQALGIRFAQWMCTLMISWSTEVAK